MVALGLDLLLLASQCLVLHLRPYLTAKLSQVRQFPCRP